MVLDALRSVAFIELAACIEKAKRIFCNRNIWICNSVVQFWSSATNLGYKPRKLDRHFMVRDACSIELFFHGLFTDVALR